MSFTLSNSFVQQIRTISPLRPVNVTVRWFDDNGTLGLIMAQLVVSHHRPRGRGVRVLVNIQKETTNKDVLRMLRRKMVHWRRVKR